MTSIITKIVSFELILALNLSLFTPSSIIAQRDTNRAETLDSFYQIQLRYDMMGGILSFSCKDQEPEFFTVGFSDFKTKSTITPDTPFRIASISKLITALGVLKLVERNMLDLDTPINHYLDFKIENPNYPDIPITTRHLLSHQSSLRDGTAYNKFLSLSYTSEVTPALYELLQSTGEYYSEELFMEQAPGNWFQYSNLGFGILGTLIEQISRDAFDVYIKREIFDPLALKPASVATHAPMKNSPLPFTESLITNGRRKLIGDLVKKSSKRDSKMTQDTHKTEEMCSLGLMQFHTDPREDYVSPREIS